MAKLNPKFAGFSNEQLRAAIKDNEKMLLESLYRVYGRGGKSHIKLHIRGDLVNMAAATVKVHNPRDSEMEVRITPGRPGVVVIYRGVNMAGNDFLNIPPAYFRAVEFLQKQAHGFRDVIEAKTEVLVRTRDGFKK